MDEKEKLKKLKELTDIMSQTFDFGCTDEAWDKYAHAVYYIVSENKVFDTCLQDFIDYTKSREEAQVKLDKINEQKYRDYPMLYEEKTIERE